MRTAEHRIIHIKDSPMRVSPLHIAIIFFAIAAALLFTVFTHKSKPAAVTVEQSSIAAEERFSQYLDNAEKQNELERDQREEAEKLAKKIKIRKESVECQFWKQQKQDKRTQEKIAQFCELPPTENATSSVAEVQSNVK